MRLTVQSCEVFCSLEKVSKQLMSDRSLDLLKGCVSSQLQNISLKHAHSLEIRARECQHLHRADKEQNAHRVSTADDNGVLSAILSSLCGTVLWEMGCFSASFSSGEIASALSAEGPREGGKTYLITYHICAWKMSVDHDEDRT